MAEIKRKQYEMKYYVETTTGKWCAGHMAKGPALKDAAERDERAKGIGVPTRYHVTENLSHPMRRE